jgi:hypothetical protein
MNKVANRPHALITVGNAAKRRSGEIGEVVAIAIAA